jgi:hypothetical protein
MNWTKSKKVNAVDEKRFRVKGEVRIDVDWSQDCQVEFNLSHEELEINRVEEEGGGVVTYGEKTIADDFEIEVTSSSKEQAEKDVIEMLEDTSAWDFDVTLGNQDIVSHDIDGIDVTVTEVEEIE